jgi:hypothetical protein
MMFMNIAATNTTLTLTFWLSEGVRRRGLGGAATGAIGETCSIIDALLGMGRD